MRINCPYCGERGVEEFSVRGEVAGPRPDAGDLDAFVAYVHLRANEYGRTREYWYHVNGCRRWLILTRDTRDHAILSVEYAKP